MKKDMRVYLDDIMESIDLIEKYTKNMEQAAFFDAKETQDAVMRRLGIIGEATNNITDEFKAEYSTIPWHEMAGMRNVLVHEYSGVKLGRVWSTIEKDLPKLKKKLIKLIKELG